MRLIDADALAKKVRCAEKILTLAKCPTYASIAEAIIEIINDESTAPTLDYAPVVHGEWKYFTTSEKAVHITNWLQCSVCGRMWDRLEGTKYNYCPSCGAKMDGGKKDE